MFVQLSMRERAHTHMGSGFRVCLVWCWRRRRGLARRVYLPEPGGQRKTSRNIKYTIRPCEYRPETTYRRTCAHVFNRFIDADTKPVARCTGIYLKRDSQ